MTPYTPRLVALGLFIALGLAVQAAPDGNAAQVATALIKAIHGPV